MNTAKKEAWTSCSIEYLRREEGDERRDKRRCTRFRKEGSYCNVYCGRCHGSAHCPYYSAANPKSDLSRSANKQTIIKRIQQDFPFTSKVNHRIYGNGIVVDNKKGKVIVAFAKTTESFSAEDCIQNGVLRRA